MQIPRPEHPKPQFQRSSWKNLNGQWAFEIDNGRSGLARGLAEADAVLSGTITVPFCPESSLSGVGHKDFMYGVWYQRSVTLTEADCAGRVFLHFGAVDYECDVYVNGQHAGSHRGGYVSFRLEITGLVKPGDNVITVYARDDTRDPMIPRGKQCEQYHSVGCDYTRTTGIWQTVWLELTPMSYIRSLRCDGSPETGSVILTLDLQGQETLTVRASYEGVPMGEAAVEQACGQVRIPLQLAQTHLWEPGCGRLYDLELTFGQDRVESYFGLRSIRLDDRRFWLNGKPVFQRLVLDQGFYPDGIYTAPSDEALQRDIDLSMVLGFNGARLHEKVFEERFLYHCDRKGYLVWGEYPNWGADHTDPMVLYSILPEWVEAVNRDYNHPAIIGWCPFNETWDMHFRRQHDDLLRQIYRVTKAIDPGRPCIDTSGNYHVETDIYDTHDYEQDPAVFKANHDRIMTEGVLYDPVNFRPDAQGIRQQYEGGPVFVSEFGGIRWTGDVRAWDEQESWGYGEDVADLAAFQNRFRGLVDALLDNDRYLGFCYTQLTDIEQEQNGMYTYDRKSKFDPEWVRSVLSRQAAVEKE